MNQTVAAVDAKWPPLQPAILVQWPAWIPALRRTQVTAELTDGSMSHEARLKCTPASTDAEDLHQTGPIGMGPKSRSLATRTCRRHRIHITPTTTTLAVVPAIRPTTQFMALPGVDGLAPATRTVPTLSATNVDSAGASNPQRLNDKKRAFRQPNGSGHPARYGVCHDCCAGSAQGHRRRSSVGTSRGPDRGRPRPRP